MYAHFYSLAVLCAIGINKADIHNVIYDHGERNLTWNADYHPNAYFNISIFILIDSLEVNNDRGFVPLRTKTRPLPPASECIFFMEEFYRNENDCRPLSSYEFVHTTDPPVPEFSNNVLKFCDDVTCTFNLSSVHNVAPHINTSILVLVKLNDENCADDFPQISIKGCKRENKTIQYPYKDQEFAEVKIDCKVGKSVIFAIINEYKGKTSTSHFDVKDCECNHHYEPRMNNVVAIATEPKNCNEEWSMPYIFVGFLIFVIAVSYIAFGMIYWYCMRKRKSVISAQSPSLMTGEVELT